MTENRAAWERHAVRGFECFLNNLAANTRFSPLALAKIERVRGAPAVALATH